MKGGQGAPVGGPSKSKSGKSSRAAPSSADLYWTCTGLVLDLYCAQVPRALRALGEGAPSASQGSARAQGAPGWLKAVRHRAPNSRLFCSAAVWLHHLPVCPTLVRSPTRDPRCSSRSRASFPPLRQRSLRQPPPLPRLSASTPAVVWLHASYPLLPAAGAFLHPPQATSSNRELRELFGCGGMLCSRPNGHIRPGYARRIHPDPDLHTHVLRATGWPGPAGFGPSYTYSALAAF